MASSVPFRRSKNLIAAGITAATQATTVISGVTTFFYVTATVSTTLQAYDLTTNLKGDSLGLDTVLTDVTSDASPLRASYVIEDAYTGSLTLYYDITGDPIPLLTLTDNYDYFQLNRSYKAGATTKTLTTWHVRGTMNSDGAGKGEQLITLQLGSLGIDHTWS